MPVNEVLQQLTAALAATSPPARSQYIPSIAQLGQMYAAGVITATQWGHALDDRGIPQEWKTAYLQMLIRSTSTEVRAMMSSVALGRYKAAWTDQATLKSELQILGYQGDELGRLVYVAFLDRDTAERAELLATYKEAYAKQIITRPEADAQLERIIPSPIDREQVLDRWDLLNTPKPPAAAVPAVVPAYKTEEGKLRVDSLKSLYRAGRLAIGQLIAELQMLQMSPALASAVADNLAIEISIAAQRAVPARIPMYLTPSGQIRVNTLRESYRKSLISAQDLRDGLDRQQMPPDLINAIVADDTLRQVKPTPPPPAKRIPMYQTDAGKAWIQAIRVGFRAGAYTPEELLSALTDLEMPTDQAQAIVTEEVYRQQGKAPPQPA